MLPGDLCVAFGCRLIRRWRLAILRGEQMQEFAWPGRTAETELALDLEKAA